MNHALDKGSTFVTGGDVSRFQRRSMPTTKTEAMKDFAKSYGQGVGQGLGSAIVGGGGPARVAVTTGPVVRVTRGKETVAVPVSK
jgi:pilus assembly protein CpaB